MHPARIFPLRASVVLPRRLDEFDERPPTSATASAPHLTPFRSASRSSLLGFSPFRPADSAQTRPHRAPDCQATYGRRGFYRLMFHFGRRVFEGRTRFMRREGPFAQSYAISSLRPWEATEARRAPNSTLMHSTH